MFLDIKHKVIGKSVVSKGGQSSAIADPKVIFSLALKRGASRIIVAHNHPSGSLEPSDADIELTTALIKAGQVLDMPVLDHLIIGNGDFTSIRQTTCLWR